MTRSLAQPCASAVLQHEDEEGACTFSFGAASCSHALYALWQDGALCDVALEAASGPALPAHRIILAASSAYFQALFLGAGAAMHGSSQPIQPQQDGGSASGSCAALPRVKLHHFEAAPLREVVGCLYEGRVTVAADKLPWLLEMGSYLEVPPIVDACCQFLRKNLSLQTCVDVLLLASQYHCAELRRDALAYTASRLPSLLLPGTASSLSRLPRELLVELLSSEELAVDSELDVLSTVSDWVAADVAERGPMLPDLIPLVQLAALPPEPALPSCLSTSPEGRHVLHQIMQNTAAVQRAGMLSCLSAFGLAPGGQGVANDTCSVTGDTAAARQLPATDNVLALDTASGAGVMQQPAASQQQPQHKAGAPASLSSACMDVLRCSDKDAFTCSTNGRMGYPMVPAPRRRGYRPSRLLVAGGHDLSWRSLKCADIYDPATDTWQPTAPMLTGVSFSAAALLGREVYVVGGTMFTSVVTRFDPTANGGEWRPCPALLMPRIHSAVAATAGRLYVMGGRSQVNQVLSSMECYSPGAKCWGQQPDMLAPRCALAAAAMGGRVYAVGGQAGRSIFRTAEAFDPELQRWHVLSGQMATERKYCAAAVLGGRLYVAGGMNEQRHRLAEVEAYDPREGKWQRVGPMQVARSSCGLAALQDRHLYAVGGNAGDSTIHDSVECFVPAMDRWVSLPPITQARSGLSVAAI